MFLIVERIVRFLARQENKGGCHTMTIAIPVVTAERTTRRDLERIIFGRRWVGDAIGRWCETSCVNDVC